MGGARLHGDMGNEFMLKSSVIILIVAIESKGMLFKKIEVMADESTFCY